MTNRTGYWPTACCLVGLLPLPGPSLGAQSVSGVLEKHFTFEGPAAGDGLGISVAGAGDVNRDGFPDVIVGAAHADPGGKDDAGSAFVYSGKDGALLWRFDGATVGDGLGRSVDGAGDINQDGFDDMIVGAYDAEPGGVLRAGSVLVYSGKDGVLLWQFDGSANFWLGYSVAGAGDVNKDGFADVIVGAPFGRSAYVYSGKDGAELWRFDGAFRETLGWSVDGAGDVNRDGFDDVIVSSIDADIGVGGPLGGTPTAGFYVYSGRDGSELHHIEGGSAHLFGAGGPVAGAGDVDQDGFPDMIVGCPDDPYASASSASVYSGKSGNQLLRFTGAVDDRLGNSVAGAGDVNGDGFDDLIVGAASADPGGKDAAGSAFVYSGRDGTMLWQFDGAAANDHLGVSVAGTGDVNRDGFADVIVGAWDPDGRNNPGTATIHVYEPALLWYGAGLAGTGNVMPRIGTGGEAPLIGSSTFQVQVIEALGGAPCILGVSLSRSVTLFAGVTLYGDFLNPGGSLYWILNASGLAGFPGVGIATIPVPIPSDQSLLGLTTYWQGFARDAGSPAAIGLSHTQGLAVTLVR